MPDPTPAQATTAPREEIEALVEASSLGTIEAAVEYIENLPGQFTVSDVAHSTPHTYATVVRAVSIMRTHGAIRTVTPGRGPKPNVYEVAR